MTRSILLTLALSLVAAPAFAQRTYDPNVGHFYMARQQITITDDAPIINDQRTQPGPPAQGQGAMMGGRPALPKAGWTQYAPPPMPGLSTSLPKVNNGVPAKAPPVNPAMRANAGKLHAQSKAQPITHATNPNQVKTYSPYHGYGAPPPTPTGGGSAVSANSMNSQSNVQGNLLHWARKTKSVY